VSEKPQPQAVFFKGGNTKKFYEAAIFSKTYKIFPKRIVCYCIGSHSAQLVLLYLQNFQHKFFNLNFINPAQVTSKQKHRSCPCPKWADFVYSLILD